MQKYKAVIVGAGRMAGTIDDEMGDYKYFVLPYSHAAGYATFSEIELAAFADTDKAKHEALQKRYDVPRGYTDYREMIDKEKPDIVSVTTPGTSHAEITIYAANHGAKAIYCEKAMASSPAEADAMVEALEANKVKFNMGTLRRWSSGTAAARAFIDSGRIGELKTVISYSVGSLLHTASHFIDLLLAFAGDVAPDWVQGTILDEDFDPSLERWEKDLRGGGTIHFPNDVWGHLMNTPRFAQFEVICAEGALRTQNDTQDWRLETSQKHGRYTERKDGPFPEFEKESSTVRLIRDLLQAMESDGPTLQGPRAAARSVEVAMGIVESHRRGGARVSLPLENRNLWMFTH